MSYEGHYQALCKNGHPTTFPVLYSGFGEQEEQESWRCPAWINGVVCGAKVEWLNSVDDTNGESYGHHKMIEIAPEEIRKCNFDHPHVWTAAIYKPSKNPYRHDDDKGWVELTSGECPICYTEDCGVETTESGDVEYNCITCHNATIREVLSIVKGRPDVKDRLGYK
jgi:hypothetical protein